MENKSSRSDLIIAKKISSINFENLRYVRQSKRLIRITNGSDLFVIQTPWQKCKDVPLSGVSNFENILQLNILFDTLNHRDSNKLYNFIENLEAHTESVIENTQELSDILNYEICTFKTLIRKTGDNLFTRLPIEVKSDVNEETVFCNEDMTVYDRQKLSSDDYVRIVLEFTGIWINTFSSKGDNKDDTIEIGLVVSAKKVQVKGERKFVNPVTVTYNFNDSDDEDEIGDNINQILSNMETESVQLDKPINKKKKQNNIKVLNAGNDEDLDFELSDNDLASDGI